MAGELRVDTREFSRAVQEYLKHTNRTAAEVINQKSYSIGMAASKLTFKAVRAQIEAALGVVGYKVRQLTRGKNKGKFRQAGMIVSKASLAERIVRARIHRGEWRGVDKQPTKEEIGPMAEAFIKAKVGGIAYVASGWLASVGAFARAIGKPTSRKTQNRQGQEIGGATPAKPGLNPTATFWNDAFAKATHNQGLAGRHAEEGLKAGIAQEIGRMAAHTAQKLQQAANRFRP